MSFKSLKMRWASKLLKARYFVVMTDKESAIAMDGADPESFTDVMALSAQAAELDDMHEKVGALKDRHEKAVDKLMGRSDGKKTSAKSGKVAKKTTKAKKV